MVHILEKSTNSREAKTKIDQWQRKILTEILTELPEQYLESVSVFSEASRKFPFIFSLKRQPVL
jgi:hypothetical protein